MIVKMGEPLVSDDPLVSAGRRAEEQMAFYLRREFKDEAGLHVLNGLRLERDGDAAQIDHLILYRYGMIIVESKSVTIRVKINEQGEWSRWFNGRAKGMSSPILQAQRQGKFLRDYLQDHRETLLGKMLLGRIQRTFTCMPLALIVAISDSGIIERPKRLSLPEVCKADQVAGRIRELVGGYRKANSWTNLLGSDGGYVFSQEEVSRITGFLTEHHRPGTRFAALSDESHIAIKGSEPALTEAATPKPDDDLICRHCKSQCLAVQHGPYGYYLKCESCEGNTPIRLICKKCGRRERVRKNGIQFTAECEACATSRLFYTNPAPSS